MIETIGNADLKNRQEELLKNMKMLRHTIADMLGSKSFFQGLEPGAQNGVITVNGEQFPVYVTANTLGADGLLISDDIYDEENYLSLISDDDLFWYALVEHIAHQADLLQEDNNKYNDDLVAVNEEMDKLNCKIAEEIKARQGYEESLKEANKKCTEYVKEIDKLEVDNKRLSERVKTLVIEKTNRPDTAEKVSDPKEDSSNTELDLEIIRLLTRITELENENESLKKKLFSGVPTKFGEQERLGSKQANEILENYEASKEAVKMDMEMAIMHQNNLELHTKVALLTSSLDSAQKEIESLSEELDKIKRNNDYLKKEKEEAELLAYRLTRGDMHVQFDSMKSLEHKNSILKNENAELNQRLCQKVMDSTEEPEDDLKKKIAEYAQKNDDLLERNKRLNQEIGKLRVQLNSYSGASVVNHDDMQQKITKETFTELTARINELEEENESIKKKKEELLDYNTKLRQEITSLRINAGLSVADSVDGIQQISSILEPHIVNANDDMKYIITYKALNEVTERIKELETMIKDKDERINQMSKNNAALSVENKNIGELLREADRNVRFYVREVDSLEKEIKDLQSKALSDKDDMNNTSESIEMDMETAMLLQENAKLKEQIENLQKDNEDFERVAAAHLETTTKFADYKERQKRLYKHFRNLAEMIEDLMELG